MKPKFPTRFLNTDDQDFLWEMLYIALWDAPDEPRRPRTVLEKPAIRRLVENWGREDDFGIAVVDSKTQDPIGAIWSRLDGYDALDTYGCDYPLLGIAVIESHQNQGLGTLLMRTFIDSLRGRIDGLRLGANPKNARAIKLYENFGFKQYAIGKGDYPQMKLSFVTNP